MSLDLWGRTSVLPAGSSGMPAGDASIGYLNTDQVSTMVQDGVTRTYGYDAAGRRRSVTHTGSPLPGSIGDGGRGSTVNHYDSAGDNPAWTAEVDGSRTVYTDSPAGQLTAASTLRTDGTVSTLWQLTNLYGDIITTMNPGQATPASAWTTDEYGHPTGNIPDQAAPDGRYGWLGGHQRSRQAAGATILMGARLYSPQLGKFLQPDPVLGGSANAYDYANADPINTFDLDGRTSWRAYGSTVWRGTKSLSRSITRASNRAQSWSLGIAYRNVARTAGGHCRSRYGLMTCSGTSPWVYARGGTTIGDTYVTGRSKAAVTRSRIGHERVHRRQWRRYGAAFAVFYAFAGNNACGNRFERQAGLRSGGYSC